MASFNDNFNRADGALGSNWAIPSGMSGLQIISNAVNGAGAPSVRCSHVATSAATFTADQEATITISARGNSDLIGPAVRVDNAGATGYAIRSDGQNLNSNRVISFSGTTQTVLANSTTNIQFAANDTVTLRAVGTTITVLVNGVTVQSFTDSTLSSGQPGIFYRRDNTGATRGDDFTATDIGGSSNAPRSQFYHLQGMR